MKVVVQLSLKTITVLGRQSLKFALSPGSSKNSVWRNAVDSRQVHREPLINSMLLETPAQATRTAGKNKRTPTRDRPAPRKVVPDL